MSVEILIGDALTELRKLPSDSVDCCVTSPPYWGLRDYGTASWDGGDSECPHEPPLEWIEHNFNANSAFGAGAKTQSAAAKGKWYRPDGSCRCGATRTDRQLGLEPTYQEHVAAMADLFEEVRRVLKPTGTLWLNYGDSYATSVNGRSAADTKLLSDDDRTFRDKPFSTVQGVLKPKDLCGIPWRVAFALQERGWYLRQDIIWSKPNPMPESVTDRCTKAHEYLFLLTKRPRYYFDAEAIAEPATYSGITGMDETGFKNPMNFSGKHASNPSIRGERPRGHVREHEGFRDRWDGMSKAEQCSGTRNKRSVWTVATQPFSEAHFATFPPELIEPCIKAGCPVGGTVLDPFGGAGTTGLVADRLQRNDILIELNPEYAAMARMRIDSDRGGLLDAMEAA